MSSLSRQNVKTIACAAAVFVAAGLLYFLTAARDIVVGDTPELISAAVLLGVPHPPGYPLFTLLGHLFSLLPLGPVPFRVNLLSVTCNALTVGVVYWTTWRLVRSRIAALVAACALMVTPLFWRWSLVAEVFPLNNLLASLLIFLLVLWQEKSENTRVLFAAFFVAGLALSNHQTIILLAPVFGFVLWQSRDILRSRPQVLLLGILAFLLGFVPYIYVPWAAARGPFINWGDVSSFRELIELIARRSYGTARLAGTRGVMAGSPLQRIWALLVSFGPVIGVLTVAGFIHVYRRQRWYFWFSLLAFAGSGFFFVVIANLNLKTDPSALFVLERFFILPHVVLAPFVGFGVVMGAELVTSHRPTWRIWWLRFVSAATAIAVGVTVLINYRRINQSRNVIARSFAEDLFATLPPRTVLLATGDGICLPLAYLYAAEKVRPDVTFIFPSLLPADWYLRQLRKRYPDLVLPFDHYDGRNMRTFVEANKERPIALAGNLPDEASSLSETHWPYQYGLVNLIEPKSKSRSFTINDMVDDNERLLRNYRAPPFDVVKANTFESDILAVYAQPAFRIGTEFERVGSKANARNWYERAFAVDPELPGLRDALARTEH